VGEAGEVNGAPLVAGGKAPEVLEPAEASLDLVAQLVSGGVVRNGDRRQRFDGITALAPMLAIAARKALLS
jgi:hypothetical protein